MYSQHDFFDRASGGLRCLTHPQANYRGAYMKCTNIMKARQIKAARALLDWSQTHLAQASGLHLGTIRKIELGYISPRSETMLSIRSAFERNGLEFMEPDGVRHRPDNIRTYLGSDGVVAFFDDIQQTIKKSNEDVVIISKSESLFGFDTACDAECMEKMTMIKNKVNIKCLLTADSASPLTIMFSECRSLSKNYVDPAQFYVYGDKYAVFETVPMPKIIVVQSLAISQSIRQQFLSMWDKATLFQSAETTTKSRLRG